MALRGIVAALAVIVMTAAPAAAHVDLQAAEPAPDATVPTSPARVLLQFSGEIVPAADGLVVVGTDGERADTGDIERPAPNKIAVALHPSLPPGRYAVEWRVLTPDGDTQEGGHVFTVAQQETSSTTAAPTTTTEAAAEPLSADGDDGGVGWLPVVLGVAAVAAVAAGVAGILRSRRRT